MKKACFRDPLGFDTSLALLLSRRYTYPEMDKLFNHDSITNFSTACYFVWETDPVYTKRESELIQQYGQMPGAGSELDDLYDDMDDLF